MPRFRKHATLAGIFFLVSDITAIIALALYQPLLNHADFITSVSANTTSILAGAILELFLALSVAGTAIMLYPVLRKHNSSLALGYALGRAAEAIIILIGVTSLLTVLTLRAQFLSSGGDAATYEVISQTLIAIHNWTFLFGPNIILAVNAWMLGYALYTSRLVPRVISILAIIDSPILFISGIGIVLGTHSQTSSFAALLALPMFIFEVSLALRLMVIGFEPKALSVLISK